MPGPLTGDLLLKGGARFDADTHSYWEKVFAKIFGEGDDEGDGGVIFFAPDP